MQKKKFNTPKNPLSDKTVNYIHRVISTSSNLKLAAVRLGVGSVTLASHLSKFTVDGELLCFDFFKQMSVHRAKKIWGDDYFKEMIAPEIDIKAYTGAHIHEIARSSATIREAAIKLGVMDHTLARHLRKFRFRGRQLLFKDFKKLSLIEAAAVLGDTYDQFSPSQRKNLTSKRPIAVSEDAISDLIGVVEQKIAYEQSDDYIDLFLITDEGKSFDELAARFADQFSSSDNYARFFQLSSDPIDSHPSKRVRCNI